MDIRQSVFLISSADPDVHDFGTGFVVHRAGRRVHVLTCRHVVADVGGRDKAMVADLPVRNAFLPPEGAPDDLAILIVEGLEAAPVLPLAPLADTGLKVASYGFSSKNTKKGKFHARRVRGAMGEPGEIAARGHRGRIRTWDLKIDGEHHLQPGYSGSPVIDAELAKVVGVVSHQIGDGKRGWAIDIEALGGVWKNMPDGLLDAADRPASTVQEQKRTQFGLLDDKMCDRRLEDAAFWACFKRFLKDFPGHPQFFILPGQVGDCHESFALRLRDARLAPHVRSTGATGKPHLASCPMEIDGDDLVLLQNTLKDGLFEAFQCGASSGDQGIDDLCRHLNLKEHSVILVTHDILASRWNRDFPRLIRWYVREYWAALSALLNAPLFLVFFNVKYPRPADLTIFGRLGWRWFRRPAIRRSLAELHAELATDRPCHLFQELRPIEQEDVAYWFSRYVKDMMSEKEKLKRAKEMFRKARRRPMADVEDALREIIDEIDQALFQRQS